MCLSIASGTKWSGGVFDKPENEMIITNEDIFNILFGLPRNLWGQELKKYDIEAIKENSVKFTGGESICFGFEDISKYIFPFKVGDIVSVKNNPGNYLIVDYPTLDSRRIMRCSIMDTIYTIMNEPQVYTIEGYNNNGEYCSSYFNLEGCKYIPEDDCRYKNLEFIVNIKDLDEKNPLYKVHMENMEMDIYKFYLGYHE